MAGRLLLGEAASFSCLLRHNAPVKDMQKTAALSKSIWRPTQMPRNGRLLAINSRIALERLRASNKTQNSLRFGGRGDPPGRPPVRIFTTWTSRRLVPTGGFVRRNKFRQVRHAITERAHARQDDGIGSENVGGCAVSAHLAAHPRERLLDAAKVATAVINQTNHAGRRDSTDCDGGQA